MRTLGMKPGDMVLLLERRDERVLVHNALVSRVTMREELAGAQGEMAIRVAIIQEREATVLLFDDVVHMTHKDWMEGRAGLAYEEIPPQPGICRFCRCTYHRPCVYELQGRKRPCFWIDRASTVCSAPDCQVKHCREMDLRDQDQRELPRDGGVQ